MTHKPVTGPDGEVVGYHVLRDAVIGVLSSSHGAMTAREIADACGYRLSDVTGCLHTLRNQGAVYGTRPSGGPYRYRWRGR